MSTEGFDSEQSPDLSLKYDTQSSIVSDFLGGAVATVVDFGASVMNSFVPEDRETSTEDLLAKIDGNALRVYNENPDTIHTASFVGGIFVPSGLALKGMTALRDGSKAANWFTTKGKTAMEADIARLFAEGADSTQQFRAAVGNLKKATWGNAAADAIAAEAAIVASLNSHPFMEDYMKDPVKNFMQGAAIGTGIVGGIGHVLSKSTVRGITAPIEQEAAEVAFKGFQAADKTRSVSDQLYSMQTNVENWESILQSTKLIGEGEAGPIRTINDYTKNLLEVLISKEKVAIVDTFESSVSPAILEATKTNQTLKADLINLLSSGRLMGADSIGYVTAVEELTPGLGGKVRGLVESTVLKPLGIKTTDGVQETLTKELPLPMIEKNAKDVDVANTMIYSREFDSFMLASDFKNFGTAADFVTEADLLRKTSNNFHILPRTDTLLANARRTSAAVDADFLTALKYYDQLEVKKLTTGEINIASDDIASMQGLYAKVTKELMEDPDLLTSFKAKIDGKDISLEELLPKLVDIKQSEMKEMLQKGVPMETISLHLNVPLNTVKAFATSGGTDLLSAGSITRYSNAAEIGQYLSADKKALAIKANIDKAPIARMRADLQTKFGDQADHEIRTVLLQDSVSAISRDLAKYLGSDDIRYQTSILRQGLNKIVNSNIGSKFLGSTDFALRNLEEYGSIVASIGKDVQRLINTNFENLINPMKPHLNAIAKDPAALVELNTAMQVNAGLKGYREFRNGKFFVQDSEVPFKEIRNSAGKVIGKERNMVEVKFRDQLFEVTTPSVISAINEMSKAGRELYEMRATMNRLLGRAPGSDIGFWVPPFNPRGKFVGYVWDKVEDKTFLLHGKTQDELTAAKNAYMQTLNPNDIGRRYQFIDDKVDQELFNKFRGRHDPIFMESADSGMLHGGSSQAAIIPTNADVLSELVNGYENYVGYSVRSVMDASFSDVMRRFDDLSFLSQKPYKNQPLNVVQKAIQTPQDPGKIMKNALLGVADIKDYGVWQSASNLTNVGFEWGIKTIGALAEPILNQSAKLFGKGKTASDEAYTKLVADLEARGIPNPFAGMDDFTAKNIYHVQKISDAPNMTPRVLALSNSLAATVMLRFGELAQPYVNAISLPILSSAAMSRKLQNSFMGASVDPNAKFSVVKTMYDGMRFGGNPEGQKLIKKAEEMGLFKPIVSEATEALSEARSLQTGAISKVEQALNSSFVKLMSKPADFSETLVRKQAFQTGAYMAKQAYPGISDSGVMIFARDFMDQVIGNYHAAQRPVMFQGTLGVAAGLFQTYMLTMAQQIYRRIEARDWKALGKMMLAQQTIFGARSLPGFNLVSEYIGEHFSDQNIDLTTGTYRALPDQLANNVIYGLPSNLGPAITTRGEIQPRVPNLLGEGVNAIPAINMLGQAFQAADRVASAAFTADASAGRAVMEAISMQSLSRPAARISEFFTGKSLTQSGNVMYDVNTKNEDGEYQIRAILSRLAATRPIEEVKLREAYYLDTMYKSLDRAARKETTGKLKTYLRDGNLDDEKLADLAEDYFRKGGTPTGWRSTINKAIAQTNQPATNTVRNLLSPNSPLQQMIDDLD